jgi:hypothetical protein
MIKQLKELLELSYERTFGSVHTSETNSSDTRENTQSSLSIPEPQDYLLKNIDVPQKNRERLERTKFSDLFIELLKNAIEYGDNLDITTDEEKGVIILSNKINYDLEEITFKQVIDQLTSFKATTEKNFNEGLTTLLLMKSRIRVKDICLISKYTDDLYFQNVNGKESSHFITADDEAFKNPDKTFEEINKWEITIYTKETEEILNQELERQKEILKLLKQIETIEELKSLDDYYKTPIKAINGFYKRSDTDSDEEHIAGVLRKIKKNVERIESKYQDLHKTLEERLKNVLNKFYIFRKYKIRYNSEKYTPSPPKDIKRVLKKLDSYFTNVLKKAKNDYTMEEIKNIVRKKGKAVFWKNYWRNYWNDKSVRENYYKFWSDGFGAGFIAFNENEEKGKYHLLWKLNREGFYHIIENEKFYPKKDDANYYGFAVLTNNSQLTGEDRTNLGYFPSSEIETNIKEFIEKHESEAELSARLQKYSEYKDSMRDFLNKEFEIYYKDIDQVFFTSDLSKEERLVKITNYIFTLSLIFEDELRERKRREINSPLFSRKVSLEEDHKAQRISEEEYEKATTEINSDLNKNYEETRQQKIETLYDIRLFRHPNKLSAKKVSPEQFKEITSALNLNLLKMFSKKYMGAWIAYSEETTANLEDFIGFDKAIASIDPDKHTRAKIIKSENRVKVFYPHSKFNSEALLRLKYTDPEEITDLESLSISIKGLSMFRVVATSSKSNEEVDEKINEYEKKKKKLEEEIATLTQRGDRKKAKKKAQELKQSEVSTAELRRKKADNLFSLLEKLKKRAERIRKRGETLKEKDDDLGEDWDRGFDTVHKIEEADPIFEELDQEVRFYSEVTKEYTMILEEEKEKEKDERFAFSDGLEGEKDKKVTTIKRKEHIIEEHISDVKKKIREAENILKEETPSTPMVGKKESDAPPRVKVKGQDFFPIFIIPPVCPDCKKIYPIDTKICENCYSDLDIPSKEDAPLKIPFFFNSTKDWEDWKEGNDVPTGILSDFRRFLACRKATELILPIAETIGLSEEGETVAVTAWFYDSNFSMGKETMGFHFRSMDKETREVIEFIVINAYSLRRVFNKYEKSMTKTNKIFHIIDLISHEIAHIRFGNHSQLFLEFKESIMNETRVRDIYREISDSWKTNLEF